MSPKSDAQKSGSQSNLKQFYLVLGVIAVLGVGVMGYSTFTGSSAMGATRPVDLGGVQNRELAQLARGVHVGDPDAPITIMEFGDFQCPACAEFAALHKPPIIRDLVETGRVDFEFRDFPLNIHPNAFYAARAARCAEDQDLFWEFHDHLFGTQSQWSPMGDPTRHFVELAGMLSADEGMFRACLNSDAHAELVSANLAFAEALGLPSTPTILIQKGASTPIQLPSYGYGAILAAVEELEGGAPGG